MQTSPAQCSLAQEIWCHLDPKCTSDIAISEHNNTVTFACFLVKNLAAHALTIDTSAKCTYQYQKDCVAHLSSFVSWSKWHAPC